MKKFTVCIDKPEYTLDLQDSLLTTSYEHIYVKKATIFWDFDNVKEDNVVFNINGSDLSYVHGFYTLETLQKLLSSRAVIIDYFPYTRRISVTSQMSDIILKDMAPLLGFPNPTTIKIREESFAEKQLNIIGGMLSINIGCDIVSTQSSLYNGRPSYVICSLPVGILEPNKGTVESFFDMESKVEIIKGAFNQLKFTITDQDGKPVDVGKVLLECYLM